MRIREAGEWGQWFVQAGSDNIIQELWSIGDEIGREELYLLNSILNNITTRKNVRNKYTQKRNKSQV